MSQRHNQSISSFSLFQIRQKGTPLLRFHVTAINLINGNTKGVHLFTDMRGSVLQFVTLHYYVEKWAGTAGRMFCRVIKMRETFCLYILILGHSV